MSNYILNGKEPVLETDLLKFGQWFETANRIVKQTHLPDNIKVSTVFLGIDHGFGSDKPVLFETMVFGGEHDQYQDRYSTWDEAEAGHQKTIEMIFAVEK